MSNATQQPTRDHPSWLEALVPYRQQLTYALIVIAALLLVYPLVMLSRDGVTGATARPRFYWLVALFVIAVAGAVFNATVPQLSEVDKVRALLMGLGGLAGFATFAFGLALPWTTFKEVFSGGVSSWRANPRALAWTGAAVFGGLILMFASLQLARGVERTSGAMRRMLYGFNAVLGTLLLLAILGLVNVLAYVSVAPFSYAKENFDWTASGIYSLSPATRSMLTDLKQPVKVYVLLPRGYIVTKDVETLLENARTYTNQLTWEMVSRDVNREKIRDLQKRFTLPDTMGLLVLYGPETKPEYDFIKATDLAQNTPTMPGEQRKYIFTGEQALFKSLRYLTEGKTHPVVYFLQGEGELSLEDAGARGRGGDSITELRTRLEQANYTVKPLRFDPKTRTVPSDANVVVIVRPSRPFSPDALKALRDYMSGAGGKKGKLVVLMDVAVQGNQMIQTGLEGLLGEYNVKVGNGHIVTLNPDANGTRVEAVANPRSNNPIAEAFASTRDRFFIFRFDNARTVDAVGAPPRGGANYTVDKLLLVPAELFVWEENDLSKDPAALAAELRKEENIERANKTISQQNLSVAVAVSEGKSNIPDIPGHEMLNKDKEVPRLVVFGDAGWVSNESLGAPGNANNYDLFASCLSWLRERPEVGAGPEQAKERKEYSLNVADAAVSRIKYLPLGLMFLVVVGVGLGVWVVRRR